MKLEINTLDSTTTDFDNSLKNLSSWKGAEDAEVARVVGDILSYVRQHGDAAVLDYARRFDGSPAKSIADLEMNRERLQAALASINAEQRKALETAATRIRQYAEKQLLQSWSFTDELGNQLGQQVQPLDRVGLYVPGGKAAYPSSVLMNAIPAKVAGVKELIMVSPAPRGETNALVLAAAAIAGVDRVIMVGGAHAIAALAYGTESIARVDKIVGPGNKYVAEAKRRVYGVVGIDMIAGPSEIVVVCDGKTDPDWIAMDLFSQAEHDEDAQAILICPDADFIAAVTASMEKLVVNMERREIITNSLNKRGALIKVRDLDEAIELVNRLAPEHLELSLDNAADWASRIRHAGAIFLGRYTAEALGDYCAGPNHVLPTAGTARFASPLGVYDFQKRSSLIGCSASGADALARTASLLSRGEGLTAHALSAEYRIKK
jgi:histidinol dehydrogenase